MFAQKLEIAEGGWVSRRGRVQRHVSFNHAECVEINRVCYSDSQDVFLLLFVFLTFLTFNSLFNFHLIQCM